ncbi:MAG: AtpZ/AtpI family protein [Candidatus Kerfeldbacteria bacterium]|nr:AtpZ/AtpI family protein [Candidatus Kerfeldbacteria bacterium]
MSDSREGNRPLFRALSLVGNLGIEIALPLVVLAVLGRILDRKFDTSPWFLLGGILLSLVVSSFIVLKHIIPLVSDLSHDQSDTKSKKSDLNTDSKTDHRSS